MNILPTQFKSLQIAGRIFTSDEIDELICLVGSMGQTTNWATLRKNTETSGYLVPTESKLLIHAVEFVTAGVAGEIVIGHGTNDVGFASGSTPSGITYPGGDVATGKVLATTAVGETKQAAFPWEVPAGKYPAFAGPGGAGGTAGNVRVFCTLVPA